MTAPVAETIELDALLNRWCAFCGQPAQGNYAIHRDGFGVGPEVQLCDDCGAFPEPSCEDIWERISES